METDQVAAAAAVLAVIVSIAAVVVTVLLHKSAQSDQKTWELDQNTKRQRWAKDLQDRQNEWQKERDTQLQDLEARLRQPNLDVTIEVALQVVDEEGTTVRGFNVIGYNRGVVSVFLPQYSELVLPENKVMTPRTSMQKKDFNHTRTIDTPLEPGDSITCFWRYGFIAEQLAKNGFVGKVTICGRYRDKLDNSHDSRPWIIDLDSESEIIIPAE